MKSKSKLIGMPWDFASLFNEALRSIPEYPLTKREHLWASEISGDYLSRYLTMHAHPPTNPPNDRSRRKFVMGHIVEWMVSLILTTIGILKAKQLRGEVQLPGLLKVTGKLDFIAGGMIDWEESKAKLKALDHLFSTSIDDAPPIILHAIKKILPRMEMMFSRVPLMEVILEVKSIASIVFDIVEKTGKPRPTHTMQNLHYLIANPTIPNGSVLYISKDDAMMAQFNIEKTRQLLKEYKDDVTTMTEYIRASGKNYMKNLPPKAPEVHFIEGVYRFEKNMHVQWSKYLTMNYGYKDFDAFKLAWQYKLTSWNRAFKRHVLEGQMVERKSGDKITEYKMKLTPGNMDSIKEAKKVFPEWDKYIIMARKAGAFKKVEEEDED